MINELMSYNNLEKIKKFLLLFMILMLPLHYFVVFILLNQFKLLRIWKEIIILILVLITLIELKKGYFKMKFNLVNISAILFMVVNIICLIITPYKMSAINITRSYILPILTLFVVQNTQINKKDIKLGFTLLAFLVTIIAVYGVIQSNFLGHKFLIDLGYPLDTSYDYKRLTNSFYMHGAGLYQRNVSTFVSPNTAALFFNMCIILFSTYYKEMKINKLLAYTVVLASCISTAFTFSRTGWISLTGSFLLILSITNFKNILRLIKKYWFFIVMAILLFVLSDYIFLESKIFVTIYTIIYNTITLKDTSIVGHINSIKESVYNVLNNPMGYGLGINGPRALSYFANANLTESSYFLMIYEFGFIGAFVYFSIYLFTIIFAVRNYLKTRESISLSVSIVLTMYLIAYLALPFTQDFEIMCYVFLTIGFLFNQMHESKN